MKIKKILPGVLIGVSHLNVTEGLSFDESIQEYQVQEYEPQTGASLNTSGAEIRINIETQDLFVHPAESYLLVQERLLKNGDTDADLVSFVNYGIMYLFKSIGYNCPVIRLNTSMIQV